MKTILFLLTLCSIVLGDAPTFKSSVKKERFFFGRVKPPVTIPHILADKSFLVEDLEYPKALDLRNITELSPVRNQGRCGSCVYFAVTSTWEDTMRLRGMVLDKTAPQYLMDCAAREWRCNGSYFTKVAGGLVKKGGSALESEYPYKARNQSCQGSPKLVGIVEAYKLIDRSPKSIIGALNAKYPVATTIGAGGPFMNYDEGVMNLCSNVGTNHQMEIVGYDCETSVDEHGHCKFDANGKLPPGVGTWTIRNSWGNWGNKGFITMKMTNKKGQRCNNVAEEVGIIEVGTNQ